MRHRGRRQEDGDADGDDDDNGGVGREIVGSDGFRVLPVLDFNRMWYGDDLGVHNVFAGHKVDESKWTQNELLIALRAAKSRERERGTTSPAGAGAGTGTGMGTERRGLSDIASTDDEDDDDDDEAVLGNVTTHMQETGPRVTRRRKHKHRRRYTVAEMANITTAPTIAGADVELAPLLGRQRSATSASAADSTTTSQGGRSSSMPTRPQRAV